MKKIIVLPFLAMLSLFLGGCSEDPGPIPENMSRIKVTCTGFDLNSHEVVVTATGSPEVYYQRKDLGCIFSDTVYFNVPIPPYSYDVQYGMTKKTVVFTGVGEQKSVDVESYFISYSSSL